MDMDRGWVPPVRGLNRTLDAEKAGLKNQCEVKHDSCHYTTADHGHSLFPQLPLAQAKSQHLKPKS